MKDRAGFTLLEVLVAGGLLAIGILALVTLQAQALLAQRRVRVVRELVAVAEAELERALAAPAAAGDGACATPAAGPVVSCRVVSVACRAVHDDPCGGPSAARAYRVGVTVEGSGGQSFELRAVTARFPP